MKRLTLALLFATISTPLALLVPTPTPAVAATPDLSTLIARSQYATLVSSDWESRINVRDDASTRAYARHYGFAGDRVEVLDRATGDDGYMWYFVRFTESNATGWVRGDFVAFDSAEY